MSSPKLGEVAAGRRSVSSIRFKFSLGLNNGVYDNILLLEYSYVLKPECLDAIHTQQFHISLIIYDRLFDMEMIVSVQLNGQSDTWAIKIKYVVPNAELSPKLQTIDLFSPLDFP